MDYRPEIFTVRIDFLQFGIQRFIDHANGHWQDFNSIKSIYSPSLWAAIEVSNIFFGFFTGLIIPGLDVTEMS